MIRTLLLIGTFLLSGVLLALPATAQDASDSGRTNQEIKKRIDRVIEEKKQEVEGALAEINTKKRGFVGPIDRVSETSLTIATHKGPLVLPLSDEVVVRKANKKIAITDLSVGDFVIALGIETDGAFMPKFILSTGSSEKPKDRVVLLGNLTQIDKSTVTLRTRGTDETKEITIGKTTEYQNADGSKIALKLLEEDLTILVVATDDEGELTATTIRSLAPLSGDEPS
ncbi:MAG: hypothetical protein O2840_02940 [bacterium]|nr:hypothetical protein [bacterium]